MKLAHAFKSADKSQDLQSELEKWNYRRNNALNLVCIQKGMGTSRVHGAVLNVGKLETQ